MTLALYAAAILFSGVVGCYASCLSSARHLDPSRCDIFLMDLVRGLCFVIWLCWCWCMVHRLLFGLGDVVLVVVDATRFNVK
ncbi:hypothetical protein TSUD_249670 [Trifolium subterraneum]|nr:hypothetical protein TSUD_249670 [Trifolium subterraneum]